MYLCFSTFWSTLNPIYKLMCSSRVSPIYNFLCTEVYVQDPELAHTVEVSTLTDMYIYIELYI